MTWLKSLVPLLETGFKMYMSGQMLKQSAENAKGMALRSGIIAFGTIVFLVFFASATVMTFVDLGHQFESQEGIHFSGMMLSSTLLTVFGLIVFGICCVIIKLLTIQDRNKKELERTSAAAAPQSALLLLLEEFIKQLIVNLSKEP